MNLADILTGGGIVPNAAQPVPMPAPPMAPVNVAPMPAPQMPAAQGVPMPSPGAQPVPMPGQVPTAEPPTAEPDTQSKWMGVMERLRDPNVMQPLQTFFAAISAPLAPWETTGSRLGRASMLMQMHKNMLEENARNRPMEDEIKQLELRGKRAEVEGSEAKAKVDTATVDSRIEKFKLDLENAQRDGNIKAEQLAEAKLLNQLKQKYGDAQAAAELDSIKARTEASRANAARDRAGIALDRARAQKEAAGTDEVWQRQVKTARGLVEGALMKFRAANPGGDEGAFHSWVAEQAILDPTMADVATSIGILRGEGQDPLAAIRRTGASPTGAAGNKTISAAELRARRAATQSFPQLQNTPSSGNLHTDKPVDLKQRQIDPDVLQYLRK